MLLFLLLCCSFSCCAALSPAAAALPSPAAAALPSPAALCAVAALTTTNATPLTGFQAAHGFYLASIMPMYACCINEKPAHFLVGIALIFSTFVCQDALVLLIKALVIFHTAKELESSHI